MTFKIERDALWLSGPGERLTVRRALMKGPESSRRWQLDDGSVCTWSATTHIDATLSCVLDSGTETFSLIAQRQPDEVAALERRIAQHGPLPTLCEKAIRCCDLAMPALNPGGPCDVPMEMGEPPQPDKCFGYLVGIRKLFEMQRKKLPAACS